MACNTTLTGITKGCDNNIGGLKKLYILPAEFLASITVTQSNVTAIGLTGGAKFVEYSFNKGGASYVGDTPISLENGSTVFNQTVTVTIPRRDLAKRNSISLIASGQRDLVLIVQDQNNIYWLLGYSNYSNLTALGDESGTAKADGSKYTLTFLAEEPDLPYTVTSSIIAALLT